MPDTSTARSPYTPAEALARRLSDLGASFFVVVGPDDQPSFTFRFSTLPPSKAASLTGALILQRVAADEHFRNDLFVWLHANGRLFQRADDRPPEQAPLDENWTSLGDVAGALVTKLADRFCRAEPDEPAAPALASNR